MKKLIDLIPIADGIEIDRQYFIQHFDLDVDGVEDDDDVILILEVTYGYDNLEWYFTTNELNEAVYDPAQSTWVVIHAGERFFLRLYTINLLEA